jgi:predicted AlkP superfamily pyrophosphatase or phosphodiesterase
MKRLAVLNVVGLTESLLGEHTPAMAEFQRQGSLARVKPAFPAVTCTAQSDYLTGQRASRHGIVANGWYNRELSEVQFWKQSNHLVQAPKIWETLRAQAPGFTCATLFWWFNMYSSVDYSITPRPMYPADGRKVFDIYTWPYNLGAEIKRDLGEFPFPAFWGPAAGVDSSRFKADAASQWIAESAKWIERKHSPTLSLVYLPHLDYNLQRLGPGHPDITRDLRAVDSIVGDLLKFFAARGVEVLLLSEYGIVPVSRPVNLNRLFRERGWLTVKEELGLELLDAGNSRAFAVADHQVAHVYVNDCSLLREVQAALESTPGVARVLGEVEKTAAGLNHPRAGDLVAVAQPDAWFTYYYWLEDARAPDFARTVDIHRKPGFDPVELFLDPELSSPKLRIAWRLLQKRFGFRMLMDVIPLDAGLVKGSHGSQPNATEWPVVISSRSDLRGGPALVSTDVFSVIMKHVLV